MYRNCGDISNAGVLAAAAAAAGLLAATAAAAALAAAAAAAGVLTASSLLYNKVQGSDFTDAIICPLLPCPAVYKLQFKVDNLQSTTYSIPCTRLSE